MKNIFRYFLEAQDRLKNYSPKSRVFTSAEEVVYISDILHLEEIKNTEKMREMRNMVVTYYYYLIHSLTYEDPLYKRYWNAMMSVTAVIDYINHRETA